jgi:hypothetical protein
MVIGIVIPHETRIAVFEHQFGALADYQAAVGGYDWEKRQGNPWIEPPWGCWRLLTLETRMESWCRIKDLGSRQRVGIRRRRRLLRSGW